MDSKKPRDIFLIEKFSQSLSELVKICFFCLSFQNQNINYTLFWSIY